MPDSHHKLTLLYCGWHVTSPYTSQRAVSLKNPRGETDFSQSSSDCFLPAQPQVMLTALVCAQRDPGIERGILHWAPANPHFGTFLPKTKENTTLEKENSFPSTTIHRGQLLLICGVTAEAPDRERYTTFHVPLQYHTYRKSSYLDMLNPSPRASK